MKTIFSIVIIAFFTVCNLSAQTEDIQVHMAARYLGDSVVVRWAPADFKAWTDGIRDGFSIERTTIKRNGKLLPANEANKSKRLVEENLMPAGQEKWEQLMQKSDMAGIAAAAIFGEDFLVNAGEDDEVTQMVVSGKEQENRYNFGLLAADHAVEIARAMGLAFVDYQVARNEEYLYKVHIGAHRDNPGLVLVNFQTQPPLIPAPELKVSFKNKSAHLVWDATGFERLYSTYIIERSAGEGQPFSILNSKYLSPGNDPESGRTIYMYLDSLADNQTSYQYRLRGKTIFEEQGPASGIISGTGKEDRLNANVQIENIIEYPEGQMQIQWIFDKKFNDRIIGFNISRAGRMFGEYVQINRDLIRSDVRIFTDEKPLPSNYYVVTAIDENGYILRSFTALGQLLDHDPPKMPEGLTGSIDDAGQVTLLWKPNHEPDLKGYRVFFSNQKEGEYTQVTSRWLTDTTYTHSVTMNTLNEEVYFKVLALDFHENFSRFSAPCIVKRPDRRPPAPPVIISLQSDTGGVHLKWAASSSKDVVNHFLLRQSLVDRRMDTLEVAVSKNEYQFFTDETGTKNDAYLYWLEAVDDANLVAASKKLTAVKIDDGKRPAVSNFDVSVNRYQNRLTLSWVYPELEGVREVVLFRSAGENKLSTYKVLKKETLLSNSELQEGQYFFEFKDQNLAKTRYSYRLMVRFEDNSTSPPSKILEVNL